MSTPNEKPVELKLFGKTFSCTVCNETLFWQESGWFMQKGGGLFNRTQEAATCMICSKCGYVHWFLPRRGSYEVNRTTEEQAPDKQSGPAKKDI